MNQKLRFVALIAVLLVSCVLVKAQSRPRKVRSQPTTTGNASSTDQSKPKQEPLLDVIPTNSSSAQPSSSRARAGAQSTNTAAKPGATATAATGTNTPILTPAATTTTPATAKPTPTVPPGPSAEHALELYKQKQYDAALKEARQVSTADPKNIDAWKLAGFAEMELKLYKEAAVDLQKAFDLLKAANDSDVNTNDTLGEAYARSEAYDKALPYLVTATTRATNPNLTLLYFRGFSELRTGKAADAKKSFEAAVKANPKDTASLSLLGNLAFDAKDYATAIADFNRVTVANPKDAGTWKRLIYAYLQRAEAATGPAADADYLSAVSASDSLLALGPDPDNLALQGSVLYAAKQFLKATVVLERAALSPKVSGNTLYLLGLSYYELKNYPKTIAALERAALKTPDNAEVYRTLGYCYEVSKLYAKALAAYQKGLSLVPGDAYFKESVERVKPLVK